MAEMENASVTEIKRGELIISRVNTTKKDNVGAADRTSTTAGSQALEGSI